MDSLADQIERLLVMLEGAGGAPAVDPGNPAALRSQLAEHFAFTAPVDRADLLNAAAILLRATSAQGDHGKYFGSIAAGSREATVAGDVLESGLGLLPVVWELAPGAVGRRWGVQRGSKERWRILKRRRERAQPRPSFGSQPEAGREKPVNVPRIFGQRLDQC